MTKNEFMTTLKQALSQNNVTKIDDIVADYEEHFAHAKAEGKSEDEISKKLGNPETIAKAYETESMIVNIKDPEKPFKLTHALTVLGRLIILAPFNFLVLCIPGSILFGLMAAGWSIALGFAACAVGALVVGLEGGLMQISGWLGAGVISMSLAFAAVTVLAGFVMFTLTKQLLIFIISYLQWNLKFILER